MESPTPEKGKRPLGRPPAGARAGEKVKDYPQLAIRVPQEVKDLLQALAACCGKPQWRVVMEALEVYKSSLQPETLADVQATLRTIGILTK